MVRWIWIRRRQRTANALGPACFTAVYIGEMGSGEFVCICLFFSFWDLPPPISVIVLLCFEVKKLNQITEHLSGFKNLKCNNSLCALKNSCHQTLEPSVYLYFCPGWFWWISLGFIFTMQITEHPFGRGKTVSFTSSPCLRLHTSQKWCCVTSRCHFEHGYIHSCHLYGPFPCPLPHSSG